MWRTLQTPPPLPLSLQKWPNFIFVPEDAQYNKMFFLSFWDNCEPDSEASTSDAR